MKMIYVSILIRFQMDGPRDLVCILIMTRTKLREAISAQSLTLPQSYCCHLLLEISTKIRWLSLRFLSGALVTRTQHTYFGLHPAPLMSTYWMETTLKISIPGIFYGCGWQLQHAESTLSSFPVSRWPDNGKGWFKNLFPSRYVFCGDQLAYLP